MTSYLSYQLTDEEKVRETEIGARQRKLYAAERYMKEQLDDAKLRVSALESGIRSIQLENNQLRAEHAKLHRWDRPIGERHETQ